MHVTLDKLMYGLTKKIILKKLELTLEGTSKNSLRISKGFRDAPNRRQELCRCLLRIPS